MEHTEHTFLGIDLGTSAMKLVLIDGNKNVLAQITEEYQAVQPERGFSEIDPEIWYDCMVNAMDRILMQCDRSRIRGIGVTGQMHTLVVLDATTGQNALQQAKEFNDVAEITGIVLTKMDGTAKGGIAVAIHAELGVPVKYIGVGETIDDLQKFDADDFVNALFERPKDDETSEEVSENK